MLTNELMPIATLRDTLLRDQIQQVTLFWSPDEQDGYAEVSLSGVDRKLVISGYRKQERKSFKSVNAFIKLAEELGQQEAIIKILKGT